MGHLVIVGLLVVLKSYNAMRVGACGVEFDNTTQPSNTTGSASLPCISDDNSSQCSNTSDNCTAQDNGSERATVAVAALVGSSIAIISVTALVFIPIAVAAGVLKRKRHTLKQGRNKIMRQSTRKRSKKASHNESKTIVNHDHIYETVLPMPNTFPRQEKPKPQMYEVPLSSSLTLTRLGNDASTPDKIFFKPHNSEERQGMKSKQDEDALTPSLPQEVVYINWRQKDTDPLSVSGHHSPMNCCINDTHLDLYKAGSTEQREGQDGPDLLETSTDSWVMLAQKIAGHTSYTSQDV